MTEDQYTEHVALIVGSEIGILSEQINTRREAWLRDVDLDARNERARILKAVYFGDDGKSENGNRKARRAEAARKRKRMLENDDSSTMILSLDIQVTNNARLTPEQRKSLVRLLKKQAVGIEAILAMHPAETRVKCEARSTGVGMTAIDHRSEA